MYVTINPDRIFKIGEIPSLHLTFTCNNLEGDVTKEIFDHIKKDAVSSSNGWYNVHALLRMRYNDKNQIEFEERQDTEAKVSLPLTLLPSLLLRDWKVIQQDEFERLNNFIEVNPLVVEAIKSNNNKTPISRTM